QSLHGADRRDRRCDRVPGLCGAARGVPLLPAGRRFLHAGAAAVHVAGDFRSSALIASAAAFTPERYAPCAVEKSASEQCSPAKNSFPFTGRASIARAACAPSEPYEYAPSDQGSRAQADSTIGVSRLRMSLPSAAL